MNADLIHMVRQKFRQEFTGEAVMVFSPGRINLIGEHTDYNDGFVCPAAIDKGIVLMIGKSDADYSRIISMDMNETLLLDLNALQKIEGHTWKNYIIGVIAELIKGHNPITNFNCVFKGDIPVGAGLSSSAALENSLVFGCNECFQLGLTKREMIVISQSAEHHYVGVKCGIMDQFASMFGKADHALFLDCKTLESQLVFIDLNAYDIILVNTNVKHDLAESAYNERYEVCEDICKKLNKPSLRAVTLEVLKTLKTKISESHYNKGLYVLQENQRVVGCVDALKRNDIRRAGELLFKSHSGQSEMYDISCKELDFLVEEAKKFRFVIGARMMGGGFGGCTINLVLKSSSEAFQGLISESYRLKFNRDCSIYKVRLSDGTKVIK